jgi:uncharacterized protein YndB with AHSA1/START domain
MSDTQNVICREIFIAAAPEAVFDFFVDPAMMARWFGLSQQLDPRPGGMFRVEISRDNVARGVYTEVSAPRRIAFTWGWESHDAVVPKDGGTLVRFRHSGLPDVLSGMHGDRWSRYLARLEWSATAKAIEDERVGASER